jgi:bifunctional DNA-binding transcriptional regulator/antitoxin component of YhaV-PrlF toxin-antitoxin module
MTILSVSSRGRVALPRDVLKRLGVHSGGKIVVEELPDGRIQMKAAGPPSGISDSFGLLKREGGPSLSIEDIGAIAGPTNFDPHFE